MTVYNFKNGKSFNYTLSPEDKERVNEIVKNIFQGIDQNLKLYFSEQRLEQLNKLRRSIRDYLYQASIINYKGIRFF